MWKSTSGQVLNPASWAQLTVCSMHANMKIKAIPGSKAELGLFLWNYFSCVWNGNFSEGWNGSLKPLDLLNTKLFFPPQRKTAGRKGWKDIGKVRGGLTCNHPRAISVEEKSLTRQEICLAHYLSPLTALHHRCYRFCSIAIPSSSNRFQVRK